jgi:hypothetical protein
MPARSSAESIPTGWPLWGLDHDQIAHLVLGHEVGGAPERIVCGHRHRLRSGQLGRRAQMRAPGSGGEVDVADDAKRSPPSISLTTTPWIRHVAMMRATPRASWPAGS